MWQINQSCHKMGHKCFLIRGDWLSCDPLRGSHDSQSPHMRGDKSPLHKYVHTKMKTSREWWDDWNDTVLQTQDSKFEPWRSEAEHATSRSRRLPTIRGWGRNSFVSFKPPRPRTEPRTLAWKAAVLTTTLCSHQPGPTMHLSLEAALELWERGDQWDQLLRQALIPIRSVSLIPSTSLPWWKYPTRTIHATNTGPSS